jgi:hypothetical protein
MLVVFETKDVFIRFGISKSPADHLFDVDRIMAQAFEDFFLLSQLRLGLGQSPPAGCLLLALPVQFLAGFPKIQP